MLLMGLRLREGIEMPRYQALAGKGFDTDRLSFLQAEGFVEPIGNSRIRATPSGMAVLNTLVAELAR